MLANISNSKARASIPFPLDDALTLKTNWHSLTPEDFETVSHNEKSIRTWNALSSLLSHLQFLNYSWSDLRDGDCEVVYIGKFSPHFYILSKMYSFLTFNLHFTTESTDVRFSECPNVKLLPPFTENDVEFYKAKIINETHVFFIFNQMDPERTSDAVMSDEQKSEILRHTERWIKTINPSKCLVGVDFPLHFHPYPDKSEDSSHFSFLDGVALRPAYRKVDSHMFNLIIEDNITMRLWNTKLLAKVMDNHNQVIRLINYTLSYDPYFGSSKYIDPELGIAKNFDGNVLFNTLSDYLYKFAPYSGRFYPANDVILSLATMILCQITPSGKSAIKPVARPK